jgi:tRNA/rRNA methyltransferase
LAAHASHVLDAVTIVERLDDALADRTRVVATSARRRKHHGHGSADPEAVLPELFGERGAILFGPEESGLDNAALDRSQRIVTIPTTEQASINLAQSVVILGYLYHRATVAPEALPTPPRLLVDAAGAAAERDQVEAMLGQLRALMRRIGYSDAQREVSVLRKYRSLLTRIELSADEVTLLRGLWYQLAWAVEQVPERLPGARLKGWEGWPGREGGDDG